MIHRVGDIGPGGAYHDYEIRSLIAPPEGGGGLVVGKIEFQKGPRKELNAHSGVLDVDLLEIVRDRITHFQNGDFATRKNACALTHIEEALMWMNKRVEDRIERDVLGTYSR